MESTHRQPLARELSSGFRLIAAVSTVMVAALLALLFFTIFVNGPHRTSGDRGLSTALRTGDDLAAVRSDIRLYTVTGAASYQHRYATDQARLRADLRAMQPDASGPAVGRLRAVQRAVATWTTSYADRYISTPGRAALLDGRGRLDDAKLRRMTLFGVNAIRPVQTDLTALVASFNDLGEAADNRDEDLLVAVSGFLVLVGIASAVLAVRRSRRLVGSYARPVAHLLASVRSMGRGEFAIEPVQTRISEIADLSDGIADMATSLRLQQKALARRAEQSQRLAERLRRVLGFAREISSSLTVPTVLATITRSAGLLTGTSQVRVWLHDDAGHLALAHDSDARGGEPVVVRRAPLTGQGVLDQAARGGGVAVDTTGEHGPHYAFALTSNARTIGVLEIRVPEHRPALPAETLEVLEVVANQGATAIEAARLFQHTELLSLSDPLTGLGNRRRLDNDLGLEVERAVRYTRPMALLMLDVDHFKSINDEHGHTHGDAVLQDLGRIVGAHLRSADTAYRYGGEELAVLARETDLAGAVRLGERLRSAVEEAFVTSGSPATVSVGIAVVPDHGRSPGLLMAAADGALYAAKRAGRNRVALAEPDAADGLGEIPVQSATHLG